MDPKDIILLALKHKVAALRKSDGSEIWSTQLPGGGLGSSGAFITLTSDNACVYAYSAGKLSCLDLRRGGILWTNDLPGYGYGLASLCAPGYPSAPDVAAIKRVHDEQQSAAASSGSV